jgi:hypothetical protein
MQLLLSLVPAPASQLSVSAAQAVWTFRPLAWLTQPRRSGVSACLVSGVCWLHGRFGPKKQS